MSEGAFARFTRWTWPERELLWVVGEVATLVAQARDYHASHDIPWPDGADGLALRRFWCAAGLAAVSQPVRDAWGWTMTLPGLDWGLFCGVEPEGALASAVRAAEPSAVACVVQRQRPGGVLRQTHLEPSSADPVAAVSQFFATSEQIATHLWVDDQLQGLLVQALPGGALQEVTQWSQAEAMAHFTALQQGSHLRYSTEALMWYGCRCSEGSVMEMLVRLPEADRRDLWGDELRLEIQCPRCLRAYGIARQRASMSE